MEAHRTIAAILRDEVESGGLTEAEAAELRDTLGRLALNMTASRRDGPVPARAAAYWLFYTRVRKLAALPTARPWEMARAAPIFARGEVAGLLQAQNGAVRFASPAWQRDICLDYVQRHPLDDRLLRVMCRAWFQDIWRPWVESQPAVRDELVRILSAASNQTARFRAATVLSWLDDPHLADAFLAALGDTSSGVREIAARYLSAVGDPRAIVPLIELVNRFELYHRLDLAQMVASFGAAAVPPLLALLENEQRHSRRWQWVVYLLGEIGDVRAVEPLMSQLGRERAIARSIGLVHALSRLGQGPAAFALVAVLADSATHASNAWGIGGIGSESMVEPIIAVLSRPAPSSEYVSGMQAIVAAAHAELSTAEFESDLFPQALREGGPAVWVAVATLARGHMRVRELLTTALPNAEPSAQSAARAVLDNPAYPRLVETLLEALGDPSVAGRRAAALALALRWRDRDERAIAAFILALEDADTRVRRRAAWALGMMGAMPAVEPLIRALPDPISPKAAIVGALGKLGDARAVDALSDLIVNVTPEQTPEDTYAAIGAIGVVADLSGERAIEPLIQVLSATPATGPDLRQSVGEWLRRLTAIQTLGRLGSPRVVKALLAVLEGEAGEPDWSLAWLTKISAVHALGVIGDPRALPALERAQRPAEPDDTAQMALHQAAARGIRGIRERGFAPE